MVVKVYVSGISGNKEVKKRQQRVTLILDSKNVQYELLDIAEPNMEEAKEYMQTNSKLMGSTIGDPSPRHPLPPQLFNDDEYCGDYDAFDMANELDEMEKFLKLNPDEIATSNAEIKLSNGDVPATEGISKETSPQKEESKVEEYEPQEKGEEENVTEDEGPEKKTKDKSPTPAKDEGAGIKETTQEQETEEDEPESKDNEPNQTESEDPEETEKSEEA
ncbi:SH3 domain-binding glutamic acid-rich protein homolog isoform X2 [Euwallacea fornicatus]|uniref:SH3 domain-binding glutamic acid-rich protein homolog isoform X2 n=1 Tax=Euwallacea fornicatus TaxID=995702 RepID=UPI00338D72BA